jgi:hypothetical protein
MRGQHYACIARHGDMAQLIIRNFLACILRGHYVYSHDKKVLLHHSWGVLMTIHQAICYSILWHCLLTPLCLDMCMTISPPLFLLSQHSPCTIANFSWRNVLFSRQSPSSLHRITHLGHAGVAANMDIQNVRRAYKSKTRYPIGSQSINLYQGSNEWIPQIEP